MMSIVDSSPVSPRRKRPQIRAIHPASVSLLAVLLSACSPRVMLIGEAVPRPIVAAAEEALFGGAGGAPFARGNAKGAVVVELRESGAEIVPDAYRIGRTILVPAAEALQGKSDVALAACLAGEVPLVSLDELDAGRIALTVDGLAFDQPGYPFIKNYYATVRILSPRPGKRTVREADRVKEALAGLEAALVDPGRVLWIAAVGDIMLGRGAAELLAAKGPEGSFGRAHALIAGADFAVANLEGALSSRGTRAQKTYTFRFPPAMAARIADAGFDAVLLANNHAFDWGPVAFQDTLASLKAAGVGSLGAGADKERAVAPWIAEKPSGKVRFWGIASYPREKNGWDSSLAAAGEKTPGINRSADGGAAAIAAAFGPDALDVVFFHGGTEWSKAPDEKTRALYRRLIDAGADACIGSHPHVVQGFEIYKGKPIFWSLGNFLFPGMQDTPGGEQGLLAVVGFLGKRLLYLRPYPVALNGPRVDLAEAGGLADFYAKSRALAGRE